MIPRRRAAALMAVLAAWAIACADAVPQLEPLADDAVVVAFGDSLTYGTGAATDASYPAVLERRIGRRVVNAGIPGETAARARNRLPNVLTRHDPDLVIICHGGNDLLRRHAAAAVRDNLTAMVERARDHGAQVVLVGVPDPGLWLSTASLYHDVAEALEVPLEADTVARVLSDASLRADPIHPNARGYAHMAEAVEALLRHAGALPP